MKIDTFVFGKHEDAYSLRAHCKAKLGDVNGALRDLEKIQIVPIYSQFGTPPEIPFWKAYYQLKVGNNKEILSKASSNLATALFIKPEFPEAHFLKGIILYKEGYIQGACNEWSIAGESGYKAAYNLIKKHCQN